MTVTITYKYNAPQGTATVGTEGTPADTVTTETGYGQSSSAGAATTYSRGDHTHGTPAVNPASIFQAYNDASEFIGFADVNGNRLSIPFTLAPSPVPKLVYNWNSTTYSQTGTTVTVTKTGHGLTNKLNGGQVYLVAGTGLLQSGWYTNFTYVDANSFTCVSTVSQSTSGNIGANSAQTTAAQHLIPAGALGANGSARIFFNTTMSALTNGALDVYIANTNIYTNAITGSSTFTTFLAGFINQNNEAIQNKTSSSYGGGLGQTTDTMTVGTVDTSVSQILTLKITLPTAGNWIAVWPNQLEIYPGA